MVCLPVSQAMASVSVDASAGVSGQVLFPGDTLINAGLPIMKDGEQVGLDTPGSWTNTDEGRVYTASTSEDGGSIVLTAAGSVLVVESGTASKNDGSDDSKNHYIYPAEEEPSVPQDMAYYPAGETVKIKADDPSEGMVFAGWTTSSSEVSFADAFSAETTITMPDSRTTVTATYQQEQTEAPVPEVTEPAQDPSGEGDVIPVEPSGEGDVAPADPSGEGEAAPIEPSGEGDMAPVDPNAGNEANSVDQNEGGELVSIDPNAGNEPITIDLNEGGEPILIDPTSDAVAPDAPTEYTVTVNNGTGGGTFTAGTWVSVTADNIEGKVFNGWYVDSLNASLDDTSAQTASFQMPEANVTLSAQYADAQPEAPALYNVVVNNGYINDESGATAFAEGVAVTVTANDRTQENLVFVGWHVESENVSLENVLDVTSTFTMPQGDVTITATYEDNVEQTDAEQTDAPQTDAEQTDAPQTDAEQTDAPQTDAAQTDASQNEADANAYEVVVENGTGSGVYEAGSTVTVEAQAEEGKVFQNWEASSSEVQIADPTQEITTFTMPEEGVVVTAEYADAIPAHTITVENGIIDEDGGKTTGSYTEGQISVKIKANEAPEGQQFKDWTVQIGGTAADAASTLGDATASETVLNAVQGDTVITANYEATPPQTYAVKVANGTLSSVGATQDATDTSKWTVTENTQVVITANPNPAGQAFTGWQITNEQGVEVNPADLGIDAASSSLTLTAVNQNLNFQAQYEGIQYRVTVNDGVANYTTAVSGTVVTITADEAPEGMEFDYWQVETGNTSLADSFSETTSFTMPMADVTVSAFYKLKEYELTVENGTGSQQYFHMGDAVTISSNYPASGKEFNAWVATSGNVSFKDSSRWKTTFAMPASDVTVKATYKDGPSTNDNRILDIIPGGEYYTGATIKFTASGAGMGNTNPNPGDYRYRPSGYQIGNVTGSWNASPYTTSMAIRAAGEYTLKVTYSKDVFDGSNWVADGTTDTKSVTFRVIVKAAGVATGDETPIAMVVAIAAVSCILFIILLVVVIRRRRNR